MRVPFNTGEIPRSSTGISLVKSASLTTRIVTIIIKKNTTGKNTSLVLAMTSIPPRNTNADSSTNVSINTIRGVFGIKDTTINSANSRNTIALTCKKNQMKTNPTIFPKNLPTTILLYSMIVWCGNFSPRALTTSTTSSPTKVAKIAESQPSCLASATTIDGRKRMAVESIVVTSSHRSCRLEILPPSIIVIPPFVNRFVFLISKIPRHKKIILPDGFIVAYKPRPLEHGPPRCS